MSMKKRPLRELLQAPQTPRSRYAPSTPHAIRALQQRSGAGLRSANKRADVRPDSARGILRRLAKLTAKTTQRRISTPIGKENVDTSDEGKPPFVEEDLDEEESDDQRPELTLPLVEDDAREGEDESGIGAPPTTSTLPGGDYDPTLTFQSIVALADFETRKTMSAKFERLKSRPRVSFAVDTDEEEVDLAAEVGRRAVSEGPPDRFPRNSFGSIRMSDFGIGADERRESGRERAKTPLLGDGNFDDFTGGFGEDVEFAEGDETEDLQRLGKSPSVGLGSDVFEEANGDDRNEDTFKLQFLNRAIEPRGDVLHNEEEWESEPESVGNDEADASEDLDSPVAASPARRQTLTPIEAAAPTLVSRRKRVKLTRHGIVVPSLPSSIIKRLAVESVTRRGKRKPVIDKASLTALEQATEWFFEQVGEDLEAYSNHARRKKKVDASDVLTLMKRQRLLRGPGRLQDLAEQVLPPEALVELNLPESL